MKDSAAKKSIINESKHDEIDSGRPSNSRQMNEKDNAGPKQSGKTHTPDRETAADADDSPRKDDARTLDERVQHPRPS